MQKIYKLRKYFLVLSCIVLLSTGAATFRDSDLEKEQEIRDYFSALEDKHRAIIDTNAIFLTPSVCKGCHGKDPMGIANVDLQGTDINLFDDWEASMMGLSAKDPLWLAKVSHESLVNPAHAEGLQNLCTSCHAPMGHYTAFYRGGQPYTLAQLQTDSLGLSGVGCLGCHAIGADGLGSMFSGQIPYDTNHVAYGPFTNPMQGPMQLYTNITPMYSPHVSEGRFCSPCHTLISHAVDLEGNLTGVDFVEQATFQEWVNSAFPEQGKTCQSCHMPQILDPVKIAVGYTALPGRTPFNLHSFEGANSFMVKMIKDNKVELGVTVDDVNFDSSLAAISRQLRFNTLDVQFLQPELTGDSIFFKVRLKNKSGHKFPSGYPARRAFVEFVLTSQAGDTLFSSGVAQSDGNILNYSGPGEPHHNIINQPNQVQVYEMIMGDVNGDITTVLERANISLKDNRIPPLGFSSEHANYDTVRVVGDALNDPDFNHSGTAEGTGVDIVHYHVPFSSLTTSINVSVKVHYQSVPPSWLIEMRMFDSPEIQTFLNLYDEADRVPVLVGQDTLSQVLIPLKNQDITTGIRAPRIFPNPAIAGEIISIRSTDSVKDLKIYSSSGSKVAFNTVKSEKGILQFKLAAGQGAYYLDITTTKGRFYERIILTEN